MSYPRRGSFPLGTAVVGVSGGGVRMAISRSITPHVCGVGDP